MLSTAKIIQISTDSRTAHRQALAAHGIKLIKILGNAREDQLINYLQRVNQENPRGIRLFLDRGILTVYSEEAYRAHLSNLEKLSGEIRLSIMEMLKKAQSGHPGGSLSSVEILVSLYFGGVMKHDSKDLQWPDRDRFVLSKGHAAPALYGVLYRLGLLKQKDLDTLRQLGSVCQGHPERGRTSGVEISTGSLGQGLSGAVGMAIAAKMEGRTGRVFSLIGDGEEQEGQIYEAANMAAAQKLNNLVAVLDWNGLQIDGRTVDVDISNRSIEAKAQKWRALGWTVVKVDNGNSVREMLLAYRRAVGSKDKPVMIIARTKKGAGVSFMEEAALKNDPRWHGEVPKPDKCDEAISEIGKRVASFPGSVVTANFIERARLSAEEKKLLSRPHQREMPIGLTIREKYEIGSKVATRAAAAEAVINIAQSDPRIVTLSADLSDSVLKGVMAGLGILLPGSWKGRHIKAGIAESNMAGVAAGLAASGFLPIVGTFDIFVLRMLEQIRNTLAADQFNVIIVGTHAGLGVGEDGRSHQSSEVPGIMKLIPNIHCFEPADANETVAVFNRIIRGIRSEEMEGPFYLRLTRQPVDTLSRPRFDLEKGIYPLKPCDNPRLIIVTSGAVCSIALSVAEILESRGVPTRVLNLVSPSAIEEIRDVRKLFSPFVPVLTIQDAHTRVMGSILGRVLTRSRNFVPTMIGSVGIPGFGESGSSASLYEKYFNQSEIVRKAIDLVRKQDRWILENLPPRTRSRS